MNFQRAYHESIENLISITVTRTKETDTHRPPPDLNSPEARTEEDRQEDMGNIQMIW